MEQLNEYFDRYKKRKNRSLIIITIAFLVGVIAISLASIWSVQQQRNALKAQAELAKYDLRLALIFPENDYIDPDKASVKAYVLKEGEPGEKLFDKILIRKGAGGSVVHFDFDTPGLGDKLYVIVEEGGNKWRSDDLEIPPPPLRMKRINDKKVQED